MAMTMPVLAAQLTLRQQQQWQLLKRLPAAAAAVPAGAVLLSVLCLKSLLELVSLLGLLLLKLHHQTGSL
jgi:hypothetical protein